MKLLRCATFLAAFLLFQIELIISKIFLPHFGGSYLVWGACVVFFQGVLLAGYLYSHFVVSRYGLMRYRIYHLFLFLLPVALFLFPLRGLPAVRLHQDFPMVFDVFWQLTLSIGLVFFALSTMAVISQSWLAASELPEKRHPYALYAVSNLGSFAALLSYPFVFEPLLGLPQQLLVWRILYGALIVILAVLVRRIKVSAATEADDAARTAVPAADKIRWLLFSCASVIAFLSVTNIITYEVAPVPLFWVIPLGIYLLSFVLVFKERPWYPAWTVEKFHYVTAFGILFFFFTERRLIPMFLELVLYYVLLFAVCVFCQVKLLSHKPVHRRDLTAFYVYIAIGGFFGGIITSWVVPLFSSMMIEFLLSFFVIHLAFFIDDKDSLMGFRAIRMIIYAIILLIVWPLVFPSYHLFGILLLFGCFKFIFQELRARPKALFMCVLSIFFIAPFLEAYWLPGKSVYTRRNYYGIYRVHQNLRKRGLMNGTTLHGFQYLDPARALEPTAYYHPDTPLGGVMESEAFAFRRIGVIGLGIGGIAGWGRQGQEIDYFELDPDVYRIASTMFTYLEKTPAKVRCIFGDARLRINEIPAGSYDLLVVDAFSGDSIPVHLLTTEAIEEYMRVLTDGGIILFHLSNRYLDLVPVVISNARSLGLSGAHKQNKLDKDCLASIWVTVTAGASAQQALVDELGWSVLEEGFLRPWTDDRSTILPVFKIGDVLRTLRDFKPFWWGSLGDAPPLFTDLFLRLFWGAHTRSPTHG